MSAEMEIQY
jgi:pimeloyl-ACP methyl ester carboxylesterase